MNSQATAGAWRSSDSALSRSYQDRQWVRDTSTTPPRQQQAPSWLGQPDGPRATRDRDSRVEVGELSGVFAGMARPSPLATLLHKQRAGIIRVFRLREMGDSGRSRHRALRVELLAFTPDSKQIAAGLSDTTIVISGCAADELTSARGVRRCPEFPLRSATKCGCCHRSSEPFGVDPDGRNPVAPVYAARERRPQPDEAPSPRSRRDESRRGRIRLPSARFRIRKAAMAMLGSDVRTQ